jgi:hypothetical protein
MIGTGQTDTFKPEIGNLGPGGSRLPILYVIERNWLGGRDSNPDKQIQSLLSYR